MTIDEQIMRLEECKKHLLNNSSYNGLCFALAQVSKDQGLYEYFYPDNDFGIPLFTFENIIILSNKYNFPQPVNRDDFWWPITEDGYKTRLACINAIINELKLLK